MGYLETVGILVFVGIISQQKSVRHNPIHIASWSPLYALVRLQNKRRRSTRFIVIDGYFNSTILTLLLPSRIVSRTACHPEVIYGPRKDEEEIPRDIRSTHT